MAARGDHLARTFVDVADTLVAEFDIVDFLTVLTVRCVELFDLAAAGLLLSDTDDGVRVAASSNDRMQLLELFELQYDEGPCLDCYRGGAAVRCDDLTAAGARWPTFVPEAQSAGYASVYALPMRLRTQVIGSLNLLGARAARARRRRRWSKHKRLPTLQPSEFCSTAPRPSSGCSHNSCSMRCRVGSWSSRRRGSSPSTRTSTWTTAFVALRRYAVERNERLVDVAGALVDRQLPADAVIRRVEP